MTISKSSAFLIWTYSKKTLYYENNLQTVQIFNFNLPTNNYCLFLIQSFSIIQVTRNQKIRNIYWVMTDINLVGLFPKFSHIMKISIILDPCNDFPAFLGNARISFFMAISKSSAFFIWIYSKKPFIIKISIILDPIFQMLHSNHIQGCYVSFLCFFIFSPILWISWSIVKKPITIYLDSKSWYQNSCHKFYIYSS